MKLNKLIKILVITLAIAIACTEDFLDYTPKGVVSEDLLTTPEAVDQLCIAAYASIRRDSWRAPFTHMWLYGSVRSDDAYKGGGSVADQGQMHNMETFSLITVDMSYLNTLWTTIYRCVGRINKALKGLDQFTSSEYPLVNVRKGEMRFLKGHVLFLLKQVFKYPVYVDHNTPIDSLKYVSNKKYSNDQLWELIAQDFQYAVDNLPETQTEIGRANKYAASAYLAKVRLYQAYEQDENHNVTNINQARLQEVLTLADYVINSTKYGLFDDFGKNHIYGYENGIESIFAIQFSINDGTTNGNLQGATGLNYNMASPYGCCWFHVPSQNMVNAFKTDANGLPMFDTFNDTEMKDSIDFWTNSVDPRLDHTVGIPTHPFKYDPNFICTSAWARAPALYGFFSAMKEIQHPDCPCLKKRGAYFYVSQNLDILRYDDLLLMKAEALIELDREDEALPIINQIRERAENSTEWLKYGDGSYVSNYLIGTYEDGVNCTWTKEFARQALQWERRLEFAMESPRFFDLVRWGIAAETLNAYFTVEKTNHAFLDAANFTKGRDEYLPIPQSQINLVEGLYVQNNGW